MKHHAADNIRMVLNIPWALMGVEVDRGYKYMLKARCSLRLARLD